MTFTKGRVFLYVPGLYFVILSQVEAHLSPERRSRGDGDGDTLEVEERTIIAESEIQTLKRGAYPVTVIDPERFAGRGIDLNQVLDQVAGVKVRQTGGAGSSALLSIRGLEGKRVGIFVNGNPLKTPDGSFGINDLPLQLIERIEVYKGLVPAWLGGDGLGGAVNIVLKHKDYGYTDLSYAVQSLNNHQVFLVHKEVW